MRKLVSFLHVSLDGFVAGPNGEMDWIIVDDKIFEYAGNRTDHADTALYGRNTFEMMEAYWPTAADQPNPSKHTIHHSAWYKKVPKVILSKTMKNPPPNGKVISTNLKSEIEKLKKSSGQEIMMFGSPGAAHSLMAENLIDDYWIFVNPILLGSGIPLFSNIKSRTKLSLVRSHSFSNGVVCLHYALAD